MDPEIQANVIRHAQADMANVIQGSIQPPEPSFVERINDAIQENRESLPSLGAELGAMFREGIKDIRQTVNETFFGHGEHAPEMGTPMNPTPQMVTNDLYPEGAMGQEGAPSMNGSVQGPEIRVSSAEASPAIEAPSMGSAAAPAAETIAPEPPGYAEMMDQYAARGSVHGKEQEQGMER